MNRIMAEERKRMDRDDFDAIYEAGKERVLPAGSFLIREGDADETVYLILEGEFEVFKSFDTQRRSLGRLGPGTWVGEIALIREIPRTTEVVSTKPSVVLALGREAFEDLDPVLKLSLMNLFTTLATERLSQLIRSEEEYIAQRSDLMAYFKAVQTAEKESYSQSVMIRKIVDSIPSLPMYAGELIAMINDPVTDARTIASKLSEDSSLTAQVLKYVNSPYYGFQQTIYDLQHAVMLLGFNQIYQLSLYHALRGTMPDTKEFRKLHSHSILVSVLTAEIAAAVRPDLQNLATTIGLLHNFGESVIMLLKQHYPKLRDLFDSLDHEILGSMLLERWNLPQEICDSVSYQHCFQYAPAGFVQEPIRHGEAFLMLAHLVLDYMQDKELPDGYPLFISEYIKENKLPQDSVPELAENLIIPRLERKKKTLPMLVRKFLQERQSPEHSSLKDCF